MLTAAVFYGGCGHPPRSELDSGTEQVRFHHGCSDTVVDLLPHHLMPVRYADVALLQPVLRAGDERQQNEVKTPEQDM